MKALKKIYYFVITALAVPITYMAGLYFTSLSQGNPMLDGGIFDKLLFMQDKIGLSIAVSYIFYAITAILVGITVFLTFWIYYGRNSSDESLGIKIFDRNKF